MAEHNMEGLGALLNTVMANPALMQSALSLLGGAGEGGLDLSRLSGVLSGGKTAAGREERKDEGEAEKAPGPELSSVLKALVPEESFSDVENRKSSESAIPANLPVPMPGHRRHADADAALLSALRPYLSRERREVIDNIIRIRRLLAILRKLDLKDGWMNLLK